MTTMKQDVLRLEELAQSVRRAKPFSEEVFASALAASSILTLLWMVLATTLNGLANVLQRIPRSNNRLPAARKAIA